MSTPRTASPESEGPLAEFSALRTEIQDRVRAQQTLLSLQLTMLGAIFGFAISEGEMVILLIVPFSSYLLCGRLVAQHFAILRVAKYIREELSNRVPGGLHWEEWVATHRARQSFLGSEMPLLITFVGASILALAWTIRGLLGARSTLADYGLMAVWILGLATATLSAVLIFQMVGRLPAHGWERSGLS